MDWKFFDSVFMLEEIFLVNASDFRVWGEVKGRSGCRGEAEEVSQFVLLPSHP